MTSKGPWDARPQSPPMPAPAPRRSPFSGLGFLLFVIVLICAYLQSQAPSETAAGQKARCEAQGAADRLKSLDLDDLPSGYTRADFEHLPAGYNTMPNGQGVFVDNGCLFVEPTNLPAELNR